MLTVKNTFNNRSNTMYGIDTLQLEKFTFLFRNDWSPNWSVNSLAVIALGKSCLFAKTST